MKDQTIRQIDAGSPNVGELEKKYLAQAIDTKYVSTVGPFVPQFEEKFAAYINVKNAVGTQSGTSAIHIALHELGIGKGDEVIVPPLTFVASVNPLKYVDATPVFVDVDRDTWNIDPEEIEKSITGRTKAIIPVHLYGNPCAMDKIIAIAKKHNLYVIEDAAESVGAIYQGQHTGIFGDFGCFSFNGNKVMTTGGGGMVVGKDQARLKHIHYLVNQARDEMNDCYYSEVGFNYRMTNIEAALGLAQLEQLKGFVAKKREINAIYRERFKDCSKIQFQQEYESSQSSSWITCVTIDSLLGIDEIKEKLFEHGIPMRRIFMPIVEFPPYKEYKLANYKNAYDIHERGICLPSSTSLSLDDIVYVCDRIKEII